MDFELVPGAALSPPAGVGPLRIGMSRREADRALLSLRDPAPGKHSPSDKPGQHVFRPSGLMISIDCTRDALQAVEFGRPSHPGDSVLFRGVDVFALPAREVVARMAALTTMKPDPDDPASFVAPDLLLGFWRPFEADDEPGEQGYHFASVLLARPGYYDGPGGPAF